VFRGLLLDLDDTLFDRTAALHAWADAIAGRALEPAEREALRRFDGRGHRSRERFAEDAKRLGLSVDPARFPFQLVEHIVPEPGVRDTLVELARSRRIAVVTNGGPAQRLKLQKLGLDTVIRTVLVSEELGFAKPDARMFQSAIKWSELAPHELLFVGDEPVIDLAPAASLGMATAWRERAEWPPELAPPSFQITAIDQLKEIA
jgi:HAD superfamily hydrolase (TIGR01509 family)